MSRRPFIGLDTYYGTSWSGSKTCRRSESILVSNTGGYIGGWSESLSRKICASVSQARFRKLVKYRNYPSSRGFVGITGIQGTTGYPGVTGTQGSPSPVGIMGGPIVPKGPVGIMGVYKIVTGHLGMTGV